MRKEIQARLKQELELREQIRAEEEKQDLFLNNRLELQNDLNDLITPHPEFGFPGLKDGDGWCVCASWYAKAVEAGKGCPIYLKSTHQNTLKILLYDFLLG